MRVIFLLFLFSLNALSGPVSLTVTESQVYFDDDSKRNVVVLPEEAYTPFPKKEPEFDGGEEAAIHLNLAPGSFSSGHLEDKTMFETYMNHETLQPYFNRVTEIMITAKFLQSFENLRFLNTLFSSNDQREHEHQAHAPLPSYGKMPWFQERFSGFTQLEKVTIEGAMLTRDMAEGVTKMLSTSENPLSLNFINCVQGIPEAFLAPLAGSNIRLTSLGISLCGDLPVSFFTEEGAIYRLVEASKDTFQALSIMANIVEYGDDSLSMGPFITLLKDCGTLNAITFTGASFFSEEIKALCELFAHNKSFQTIDLSQCVFGLEEQTEGCVEDQQRLLTAISNQKSLKTLSLLASSISYERYKHLIPRSESSRPSSARSRSRAASPRARSLSPAERFMMRYSPSFKRKGRKNKKDGAAKEDSLPVSEEAKPKKGSTDSGVVPSGEDS